MVIRMFSGCLVLSVVYVRWVVFNICLCVVGIDSFISVGLLSCIYLVFVVVSFLSGLR